VTTSSPARAAAVQPATGALLREARRRRSGLADAVGSSLTRPLDPSDLFAVGDALLEVVIRIERARATIDAIRPASLPEHVPAQARILVRATWRLADAVFAVRGGADLSDPRGDIRDLERAGDQVARSASAALFHSGADPAEIVRLKEVLDTVESAIDAVRSASSVVVRLAAEHDR
jgi:uncharacterized protein Yka (UPF0111/DUF47 family)